MSSLLKIGKIRSGETSRRDMESRNLLSKRKEFRRTSITTSMKTNTQETEEEGGLSQEISLRIMGGKDFSSLRKMHLAGKVVSHKEELK